MATADSGQGDGFGGASPTPDAEPENRVRMTLRVSRDSGRSWSGTTRVRDGDPMVILSSPGRFPPCECPRCAGLSAPPARTLRTVPATPSRFR